MTRTISIDRRKPLAEEPRTGHNRWHPDIEPIAEVGEGEDVTLETRDACPRDDDLHSTVTHRFDSLTLVDPIVTPRRRRGNRDRPTVRG